VTSRLTATDPIRLPSASLIGAIVLSTS
jgi:hypothetical protein